MSRILVIGDLHTPVDHPGYLPFLQDLRRKYKTNKTIFIGDVVDWHAISFHAKEPNCPGPVDEFNLAKARIRKYYNSFPDAIVCIGNHDARPSRLAKTCGIPENMLRTYNDLWGTKKWKWVYDIIIDDIYFLHGTGRSGIYPAYNVAKDMQMSVAMGHVHSASGVKTIASPIKRTFAMDVGCGIDVDAFQFVYGRNYTRRPVLSAGVILDGQPISIAMPCGVGEKYHKSRF